MSPTDLETRRVIFVPEQHSAGISAPPFPCHMTQRPISAAAPRSLLSEVALLRFEPLALTAPMAMISFAFKGLADHTSTAGGGTLRRGKWRTMSLNDLTICCSEAWGGGLCFFSVV